MVNRRSVIAASLTASLSASLAGCGGQQASKPLTFVLIHGTWHGGWVWKYVREYLQVKGHRVFTPTLTGCGEREHLSSPDIGLETHIRDITQLIEFEDLSNIIISAHSFSGVAMTGAVDRLKPRIKHVNFLDALVPRPGRMSGVERDEKGRIKAYFLQRQAGFIEGYKMDYWADYPLKMLLPEDHPRAAWVKAKLTTHPAKAWTDELVLQNGGWDGLPRSYIHCTGQAFAKTSERMIGPARGEGWNFTEVNVPRNAMVTHPKLIADHLISLGTA